jgi:hypothetical protein
VAPLPSWANMVTRARGVSRQPCKCASTGHHDNVRDAITARRQRFTPDDRPSRLPAAAQPATRHEGKPPNQSCSWAGMAGSCPVCLPQRKFSRYGKLASNLDSNLRLEVVLCVCLPRIAYLTCELVSPESVCQKCDWLTNAFVLIAIEPYPKPFTSLDNVRTFLSPLHRIVLYR